MLRELAAMNHLEVEQWMHERSDEAFRAWRDKRISKEVYESICDWAVESYMAYVKATLLGYIEYF